MHAEPAETHLLFVYGTLLRGFTNHARYLGVAEQYGKAKFMFAATTNEKFRLVVRPKHIKPATCGPVLMEISAGDDGHHIPGEVFQVDNDALMAMDILEGVKDGAYYKKVIDVERACSASEQTTTSKCTAYFFPANDELMQLASHDAYTEDLHRLFDPPPVNLEIARLCQPADSHELCTTLPSSMVVYCLRLLPGADIVKSLIEFAAARRMDAAAVLTCVGSTGQTTLRPAGVPKPRIFEGKYEIVSLTGTLSRSGEHHLHMSISDPDCNVFGGHVMEGCLVRTTAEIVLGVIQGIQFTRPVDARTGYDELSITRTHLDDISREARTRELLAELMEGQ
eukprot:TRINITY_DN77507_c0_g1_i1.p1 TRINITY_DN77507_c0_g1~~TRINITY_DN77507_c0_g1_i1.p1  ORF type:complete len:338 (-),score=46.67 TRINITY_DN77507_c0_g1_i1:83-1096(-)